MVDIIALRPESRRRRPRRTKEEKAALLVQIRQMRATGMPLRAIAQELGLNPQTVYNWRHEQDEEPGFRQVTIAFAARVAGEPVLITQAGYRPCRQESRTAPGAWCRLSCPGRLAHKSERPLRRHGRTTGRWCVCASVRSSICRQPGEGQCSAQRWSCGAAQGDASA